MTPYQLYCAGLINNHPAIMALISKSEKENVLALLHTIVLELSQFNNTVAYRHAWEAGCEYGKNITSSKS